MDAMIQEREKRAGKWLQSLADMMKLRTLAPEYMLAKIMRAVRNERGPPSVTDVSTAVPSPDGSGCQSRCPVLPAC